jgi:PhnB protein
MTSSPITPHLDVDGAAAAIEFYKKAFDATEMARVPAEDGKRLMHAALAINGGQVFLHDDFPEYTFAGGHFAPPPKLGGVSVTMHLTVDNCDAWYERAIEAGATELMAPHDAFWGDRYGQVMDPFGHSWSFAHTPPAKA